MAGTSAAGLGAEAHQDRWEGPKLGAQGHRPGLDKLESANVGGPPDHCVGCSGPGSTDQLGAVGGWEGTYPG